MALEAVLREMEKDTTGRRDPEKYFVSIFGKPGGKDPWGWRFEGHHLSLNYAWDKLTAAQQAQLAKLVKVQFFRCRPDVAAEEWTRVEQTDLTKLHFAWAGGIERGEPHYYRVQNETFVVEYETMRTTRMPAVEWFFSLSRLAGRHPQPAGPP